MEFFGEHRDETIRSLSYVRRGAAEPVPGGPVAAKPAEVAAEGMLKLSTDRGTTISGSDLADQFLTFQIGDGPDGGTVLEQSSVKPKLAGSDDKPDASAIVTLVSFCVGTKDAITRDARATLRLDFGKDSASRSTLDTVFWSIAAGLNLYDDIRNKRSDPKDLKTDFNEAFGKQPIKIPGGLGRLSFEVVKHKEPKWWQKVFTFLQSGTGKALTSAIGFPAITGAAIGFLDQLLNQLDKSEPAVLFKSRSMTLALTERARRDFTADTGSAATVGVLNPGLCLLARGRDYGRLIDQKPVYMGQYGLLKPKEMDLTEFLQSPDRNPFNEMTYAVLMVRTAEDKIRGPLE